MTTYRSTIQQLDLEEKLSLTHGKSNWTFFGVPSLGYPELMCGDGPHGLRAYSVSPQDALFDPNSYAPTTLFPISAAMAATFHPELIEQVGQAIGRECNKYSVDLLLAPGLNLKRSPQGGRNFEYYSEDPHLTGVCGAAFVKGVQQTGVGACIKHYALNEQEHQRRFIDTTVDEFTLHEHYLRPFYYAITHASPLAIMSSYNRVFGHYASESKLLLQDILRKQWGYDGLVLSDWGAVQHKIKSLKNGMNLEMPGRGEFHDQQHEAIQSGELLESEVDESLIPLFRFYDRVKDNPNKGIDIDLTPHHQIARNVAQEAIVLLENDGILPLNPTHTLAVIGEFAKNPRINGGGSVATLPHILEDPLSELNKQFTTFYAPGYDQEETTPERIQEAVTTALKADVIVFFTGTTQATETEGEDRTHIQLPADHIQLFHQLKSTNKPIVVVLNNGSALDVTPIVSDANAIVEAWLLGEANGKPLADVLSGVVNPSGRLAETFPMNLEQTPHYGLFPCRQDMVSYHDDVLKNGYRYYDLHNITPRYPFGYGLSYTTFSYDDVTSSTESASETETITLKVTLTNTGDRYGQETIQVYVSHKDSMFPRPKKELKAFRKVGLNPNETKQVSIVMEPELFAVYHPHEHAYLIEAGQYQISVGSNVQHTPLSVSLERTVESDRSSGLTLEHPMKLYYRHYPELIASLQEIVGTIPWYQMEEPANRVLRRFKRWGKLSEDDHQEWVNRLRKL